MPQYRQKLLIGDVAGFVRQVLQRIATEYRWEIEAMAIQADQVQVFLYAPPK